MKSFLSIVLLTWLAVCSAAQAPQRVAQKPQEVTFRATTGEGLVKLCKNAEYKDVGNDPVSAMCFMYIAGFTDGYNIAMLCFNNEKQTQFCPPDEVTPSQIAKVLVKYGNDHPENLWVNAALFTAVALKDAYPCQE